MNELIERLLQPVPGDRPCGPDLSNEKEMEELKTLLKGKPEIEMGSVKKPAEPPVWGDLQAKSIEFLAKSKDLRVAVMLACALLRTSGLAGFRDGLQLVRGLLEKFWDSCYPLLDSEDDNDPAQRLNILRDLTTERGSWAAGWLSIADYLYAAPLCQPKGAPPINFDQLQTAKLSLSGEAAPAGAASPTSFASAMRDGAGQIATNHQALQEALEAVHGIDQFLTKTLSARKTISFENLQKVLRELLGALQPYMPGGEGETAASSDVGVATHEVQGAVVAVASISGVVRSRDDVVRALDNICKYYEQVEPSSPVPYLLRRAQKLAAMDFVEAVQELNIATLEALRPSMGSAVPMPKS